MNRIAVAKELMRVAELLEPKTAYAEGDIMVGIYGIDDGLLNSAFYQVVKADGGNVMVRELQTKDVANHKIMPLPGKFALNSIAIKAKVGVKMLAVVDGLKCRLWNGKPQRQDPFEDDGQRLASDLDVFASITPQDAAEQIKNGIQSPVVNAKASTLGGADKAAVMIYISLDPKSEWSNGIFENSRNAKMELDRDGTLEMFGGWVKPAKPMRKTKVKSVQDAIAKINKYIAEIKPVALTLNQWRNGQ